MIPFIQKTRDRIPLSSQELAELIQGVVDGRWPDYQLSAWLMAVYCRGLTEDEVFSLTGSMAFTGSPSAEPLGSVDKHSTGGVGDKTTLVLAPVMAALGYPMAKMSGRGLGHTGGTLDKLESIPGFQTELPMSAVRRQIDRVGVAVVAQSSELAPADKRLYALRDVTATVESIPLIAASVMSKKLAAGTPHLVLDVKVGNGAFMADLEQARELAKLMVQIGYHHHRAVTALLTSMNQPLGWAVGNAIEVNEARDCLKGQGPEDLRDEVLKLAAELVHLVTHESLHDAMERAAGVLDQGKAWESFGQWIIAQGGQLAAVENGLPLAPVVREWRAEDGGWIERIDTRTIGEVALELGAGRHKLGDSVDPGVGIRFYAKTGRFMAPGEVIAQVFARSDQDADQALQTLSLAVHWSTAQPPQEPLVLDRISTQT
ncbi:MAG: thymidine phosphorylase [Sulfobacillus benefaciens]|uniref:Pyrimidine-nucleoside phosphorylase n=1 Tax=Sulfobacillus benefaciens TaxID=453960 RepID=A0A2T2X4D7_9FIRM|nr:MAG: thymidine phosphorylase [Sulfobacillus benefaciens]